MRKITVKSATDELIGAATSGAGLIGTSIGMKLAAGKINPWLLSGLAIAAGYGLRLFSQNEEGKPKNEILNDLGTGVMMAGVLDVSKKGLALVSPTIADKIPALNGPDDEAWQLNQRPSDNYNFLKGPSQMITKWNLLKS